MFDVLESRIRQRVPEAVKHPVSSEEWIYASALFGVVSPTSPGIQKASILFRYTELSALSEQQSRGLKTSLRETFLESLDALGEQTTFLTWLALWDAAEDIIQHEQEHCTPYPENVRDACRIALAAVRDEAFETVELYGLMVAPPESESLSPRIQALVSSNPKTLSIGDVRSAMHFAALTGDPEFISFIEQRVGERKRDENMVSQIQGKLHSSYMERWSRIKLSKA